jgi:hypothetical protein
MTYLWAKYEKKIRKKSFFGITKMNEESFNIKKNLLGNLKELDPLVRGTDPGIRIRIRTKMSRIPNTGKNYT